MKTRGWLSSGSDVSVASNHSWECHLSLAMATPLEKLVMCCLLFCLMSSCFVLDWLLSSLDMLEVRNFVKRKKDFKKAISGPVIFGYSRSKKIAQNTKTKTNIFRTWPVIVNWGVNESNKNIKIFYLKLWLFPFLEINVMRVFFIKFLYLKYEWLLFILKRWSWPARCKLSKYFLYPVLMFYFS